jgi:hypothetical protein
MSQSGLRIFVDRASVATAGAIRDVMVRLGSPGTITGKVVVVQQREEQDCTAKRWRQLSYKAFDADGNVVSQSDVATPATRSLPLEPNSISEAVHDAVCPNRLGA